MYKTIRTV